MFTSLFWKKSKRSIATITYIILRFYKYHIRTLQEVVAKKSNTPWIWRFIYGRKLPYMKKTRKKKQVCGAACFMAAEIKLSKDVRPSVNIWLSTGVTSCRINFNFTDIIYVVCPIHDTGNGPWSSLDMCILSQLLIFTTVYAMNKKCLFLLFHVGYTHSLGQDLGRFRKPASQLNKYAHIDPITDFCI